MLLIENITAEPHQIHNILTADGEARLTLRFLPPVQMWYTDCEFNGRTVQGVRVAGQVLHFRAANWPFDIMCEVVDASGLDPYRVDDFSEGRCRLWLATRAEMAEIRGGDVP